MGSNMTGEEYVEKFGILLEDVLISRENALKSGKVEYVDDVACPKCGNTHLEKFFATNDDYCWEHLCGREGICIFCNKCMDIVEFELTAMN
jgi:hypothetical protein